MVEPVEEAASLPDVSNISRVRSSQFRGKLRYMMVRHADSPRPLATMTV
jgi:hypothetical protein